MLHLGKFFDTLLQRRVGNIEKLLETGKEPKTFQTTPEWPLLRWRIEITSLIYLHEKMPFFAHYCYNVVLSLQGYIWDNR